MNNESIVLDSSELRKLLGAASPDAALLYIYLKTGSPVADASQVLNLTSTPLQLRTGNPAPAGTVAGRKADQSAGGRASCLF